MKNTQLPCYHDDRAPVLMHQPIHLHWTTPYPLLATDNNMGLPPSTSWSIAVTPSALPFRPTIHHTLVIPSVHSPPYPCTPFLILPAIALFLCPPPHSATIIIPPYPTCSPLLFAPKPGAPSPPFLCYQSAPKFYHCLLISTHPPSQPQPFSHILLPTQPSPLVPLLSPLDVFQHPGHQVPSQPEFPTLQHIMQSSSSSFRNVTKCNS